MSDCLAIVSLKIGDPCVVFTPATSLRSLIGTGSPPSRPRSPDGFCISALAFSRARSKQRIGSALVLPSTSTDAALERVEQVQRRDLAGIEPVDDGACR